MSKTASHWLDVACRFEDEKQPKRADMVLKAAIREDEKEHNGGGTVSSTPTLLRTSA